MKYSQFAGIAACIALIVVCYMPWSYVAEIQLEITGMQAGPQFGKPGLLNIILVSLMIVLFAIPRLWAKRTNLFVGAFNIAWSLRNYLLVGSCSGGICPEKKAGIFLLLFLSLLIEIMTFIPPVKIQGKTEL